MSASHLLNPFENDYPDHFGYYLEGALQVGEISCCKYNDTGKYLASGCINGDLLIWDTLVNGVSRVFHPHTKTVTSVCWMKRSSGKLVATSSLDRSVVVLNILTSEIIRRINFDSPVLHVAVHPRNTNVCMVDCQAISKDHAQWPILVYFDKPDKHYILNCDNFSENNRPIHSVNKLNSPKNVKSPRNIGEPSRKRSKPASYNSASNNSHHSIFNKRGDVIFSAAQGGTIHVLCFQCKHVLQSCPTSKTLTKLYPKSLVISRNGKFLLWHALDRSIKMFALCDANILCKNCHKTAEVFPSVSKPNKQWKSVDVGSSEFQLSSKPTVSMLQQLIINRINGDSTDIISYIREFKDTVNHTRWRNCNFSGDSEYLLGVSNTKDQSKLYIWNISGQLCTILTHPASTTGYVRGVSWHPNRPIVVTVDAAGYMMVWTKQLTENWSAFAPNFIALEENVYYSEEEDEFDLNETQAEMRQHAEEVMVDVTSVDQALTFDSDDDDIEKQKKLVLLPLL